MKKFLIAASCLTLISPSLTVAQVNPGDRTRPAPGQGQRPGGGGGGGDRPNPGGPGGGNRPGPGGPGGGGNRPGPGGPGGGGNRPGPGGGGNRPGPGGPGGGGNRPGPGPGGPNRPGPNRPGPGGGGNRPGFRPPNRPGFGWNGHRYRAGLFRYPPGFAYRRWGMGQLLPLLFLSSAYYFTDYAALGLDPPPYGYQWVRYGPDVLLVRLSTGEIMDVEYGVFY